MNTLSAGQQRNEQVADARDTVYGSDANHRTRENYAAALVVGHACIVTELTSNKAKEDAAIAWVMELELAAGRQPRDARYTGAPADIESPPRLIEIKSFGTSNRGYDLLMEVRQVEEARRNPDYYVYVVENVRQGDSAKFTLRVLGGVRLQRLLGRAKEYRGYSVPWPVADYDNCPPGLDG